jgi:hypothetical protein
MALHFYYIEPLESLSLISSIFGGLSLDLMKNVQVLMMDLNLLQIYNFLLFKLIYTY